jgi:hypothetical protein
MQVSQGDLVIRLLLVGTALLASIQSMPAQPAPALDRLVSLFDSYLINYERDLSAVIADERFVQEVVHNKLSKTTRRLDSEITFYWLQGEMDWLGFRSVLRVDGKPVEKPGIAFKKLVELVSTNATAEIRWMIEEASKHNLGNPRTINTPNLPLDLLHRRNRRRFQVSTDSEVERINGRMTTVLRFDEFRSPTIVNFGELGDLQSHVRAWVDVDSGALWRAEVRLKPQVATSMQPLIRVEFRRDKALGILVPVVLNEEFIAPGQGKGRATYSNFRRFETSARIVPQL